MKLFGHEDSGHAYKVALTLALSEIPHDYERVDIWSERSTRPQAFLSASRWAEVPCLICDDGTAMIQSGAILLMLAREYNALNSKEKLDQCAEWINWEANRIGMCIPQLIWARQNPEEVNDGAQSWLHNRLKIDQARLAEALTSQKFLTGDDVSVADICVYGYVSKAEQANIELDKRILNWRDHICDLPHFQNASKLLGS